MDLPTLTERFGDNECHEILVKLMKHICWLTWEDCFKTIQQMKHLTPLQFDSLKAFTVIEIYYLLIVLIKIHNKILILLL